MGKYWTKGVVQSLACQWNANLIRAPMGVDPSVGGYVANKATELAKVKTVSFLRIRSLSTKRQF